MNKLTNIFSEEISKKCDEWLLKFPKEKKRSAVIEILKIIQKENGGFLNEELISKVADYLNISKIYAYEVATFYSMFNIDKVGKYKIYLCTSISCMLCGSDNIYEYIRNKLNIDFNKTSNDGKFTLKKAECLAACGGAPVMLIDEKYYENLTNNKIDLIINELE